MTKAIAITFFIGLYFISCQKTDEKVLINLNEWKKYAPTELTSQIIYHRFGNPEKDGRFIHPVNRLFTVGSKFVIFENNGMRQKRIVVANGDSTICNIDFFENIPDTFEEISGVDVYKNEIWVKWFFHEKLFVYNLQCETIETHEFAGAPAEMVYIKKLDDKHLLYDMADGAVFNEGYVMGCINTENNEMIRMIKEDTELPFGRNSIFKDDSDRDELIVGIPLNENLFVINSKGIEKTISLDYGPRFLSVEEFKSIDHLMQFCNSENGFFDYAGILDIGEYIVAIVNPRDNQKWTFIRKKDMAIRTIKFERDQSTNLRFDLKAPISFKGNSVFFYLDAEYVEQNIIISGPDHHGLAGFSSRKSNGLICELVLDSESISMMFLE